MDIGSSRDGVEREMNDFWSGDGRGDEGGEEHEEGEGGGWEEHFCVFGLTWRLFRGLRKGNERKGVEK